jgi:hypothetical protein
VYELFFLSFLFIHTKHTSNRLNPYPFLTKIDQQLYIIEIKKSSWVFQTLFVIVANWKISTLFGNSFLSIMHQISMHSLSLRN